MDRQGMGTDVMTAAEAMEKHEKAKEVPTQKCRVHLDHLDHLDLTQL